MGAQWFSRVATQLGAAIAAKYAAMVRLVEIPVLAAMLSATLVQGVPVMGRCVKYVLCEKLPKQSEKCQDVRLTYFVFRTITVMTSR